MTTAPSHRDHGSAQSPADSAETSGDVLRFEGLRRSFGRLTVLREVSGAALPGQPLLVTGSNGCGKSTLLRCLAGLLSPQRGTVHCQLEGRKLDVAARRRAVGFLSPDVAFYPQLSTAENLDFFARARGVAPEPGRQLLRQMGLPLRRPAGFLSSGMRQRLRWAWALIGRPRLLLLDEPLQNLDAPGRRQAQELLEEHLETGLAVVANPDSLELPGAWSHLHLGS